MRFPQSLMQRFDSRLCCGEVGIPTFRSCFANLVAAFVCFLPTITLLCQRRNLLDKTLNAAFHPQHLA
jgi:hypothetical protein